MSDIRSNSDIEPCLSVVMPAYNEAATIEKAAAAVLAQRPVQELIIVDDGSQDGTRDILVRMAAAAPRIQLIIQERNQGKGAALRKGFAQASAPYVIVQDADLEYDPAEYHLLLAPLLADRADVVFGSRFKGATAQRVLYYWHSIGNKFLTSLSNMATNLNLTDMETCYKVFRRGLIQKIRLEEDRFGFEPEVTAKVAQLGVRIYEVAISYYGRTYAEGKKINWQDGMHAIWCIFRYNLIRRP
ncbi:MAG TPA: glycosyltransferase family 2 protein [Candidatus Aminicenantes bacterium]|nr:glycosyltransferase family 2 protein [Candidatus Aminicenantes bacterium]